MRFWFGRILTFEVFADDTDPSLQSIFRDSSNGVIEAESAETVQGYAAYGRNCRSAIEPLADQFGVALFDDGECIRAAPGSAATLEPDPLELGSSAGTKGAAKTELSQVPGRSLPSAVSLTYYDPERDYQIGQMRAGAGASGGTEESIELAAVLRAARAKALAERCIAERWAQRDKVLLRLPPTYLSLEPGASVRLDDGSAWRVREVSIEQLVVKAELERTWEGIGSSLADPGRQVPAPDVALSPTTLALFDLPDLGLARHDGPIVHVAACQPSGAWRPVPIELKIGTELRTIRSAAQEAALGQAVTVLPAGEAALMDFEGQVEVELLDPDHWLESRDDDALADGANLAILGEELIQFGSAVPIGQGRFRLERLLRGRRGTEWAMSSHAAGETFAMIRSGALLPIELPREILGALVEAKAVGLADGQSVPVQARVNGEALRPPSPVHLEVRRDSDGALHASWVRRSRLGWAWVDETDVSVGESRERYRVRLEASGGVVDVECEDPAITFSAGQLAAVGSGLATLTIVQVGDHSASRPLIEAISLAD